LGKSIITENLTKLNLDGIDILSEDLNSIIYSLKKILSGNYEPTHIITFNLDFFYNTSKNNEFRDICQNSKFVVPDGHGITCLLKMKYKKNVTRITGSELLINLLKMADESHLKVALVGSYSSTQLLLKKKVETFFPNLFVVASISPPYLFENDPEENMKVLDFLIVNKPDIVFVAMGSPRQEIWIARIKEAVNAKIFIGVGAVFDFYTGNKKRAPILVQNIRLEWLWRFFFEPLRLFRRYFINDLPFFIKQSFRILTGSLTL
jgi:N-acetylglucosaminyldiphosphoundecaprenol N-acetyl-beta-D-mannosaminyltransferase